jgi:hypothetical protein
VNPVSLNQALPDDVVANSSVPFFAYRNYPVFSFPWLKKRSLLFGIVIALFSLPVFIGLWFLSQEISIGALVAIRFFLAFMTMATAGPALATWVRHRKLSISKERLAVVLAVIIGIIASFVADRWSSSYIEKMTSPYLKHQVIAAPSSGDEKEITHKATARLEMSQGLEKTARSPVVLATNLIFLMMIYGSLGGGLALRSYFSEQRRLTASQHRQELDVLRLQKQESALRLGVLQAQIEPHFLFNTLASLRSLVRQDPALAETTIDALVDHLRATIPKLREDNGKLMSTLGQQLDICSSYLTLMQIRMGKRLSYQISVPENFREFEFPPLMLISLVENAIKHGIETKPGPGNIEIQAEQTNSLNQQSALRVSVLDNGPGLSLGLGGGLGLSNIREQLKTRFAETAQLTISTRVEGGTIASIELPLRMDNDSA